MIPLSTISPSPSRDAVSYAMAPLLPLLNPTNLGRSDFDYLLARFDERRSEIAQVFPAAGDIAHVPVVVALAALAMEIALNWLQATGLIDGFRSVLLARQLDALVGAVVDTVDDDLDGQRERLLADLFAVTQHLTERHGCPECFEVIASALTEVDTS
jgi:hypothetical protein